MASNPVMDRIKAEVEAHPIVLFMKGTAQFPMCGFSSKASQALKSAGAQLHTVNVLEDPEIRANLPRYSDWPTFPQLFINGELIGGCDITVELFESGDLALMVAEAQKTGMTALPVPAPDALSGRVIVITGANGGLGEAAAKACAQAGATVVLIGRKVQKLNRVYDAIKTLGPEPALYPMDLAGADPSDYEAMADKVGADLGGLHGLLHCAVDFAGLHALEATDPADVVRQLHVNLTAPWLLTQACLPWLRKADDSAVVFVGDDLSRVNTAYWGAYGVAKAGIAGLARILHDETETGPVRVGLLEPGPMRTAIRSRAYVEEAATRCPPASTYAAACVHLLSAAGIAHRGQRFAPRAT